jgi:hypothetical protein
MPRAATPRQGCPPSRPHRTTRTSLPRSPRSWADRRQRCDAAGVHSYPAEVTAATVAQWMVEQAHERPSGLEQEWAARRIRHLFGRSFHRRAPLRELGHHARVVGGSLDRDGGRPSALLITRHERQNLSSWSTKGKSLSQGVHPRTVGTCLSARQSSESRNDSIPATTVSRTAPSATECWP